MYTPAKDLESKVQFRNSIILVFVGDNEVNSFVMIQKNFNTGPVLAFIKADSFEHTMKIFNNTEFGLTGSLYSNNREHLERARVEMLCGNLYFNCKYIGALVGVHPFGFNMSGTDSKAGGRDYLLLFTQAKLVSEKTGRSESLKVTVFSISVREVRVKAA